MNRTRKWEFVAQEARRLTALGLKPTQVAKRLGLNKSTVTRWANAGKLSAHDGVMSGPPVVTARATLTPEQWATTVRESYQLDPTDEQLVTIAQTALALSLDATATPTVRMTAAGRFAALVKQLALVMKRTDEDRVPAAAPAQVEPPRARPQRSGVDPRNVLQAVK